MASKRQYWVQWPQPMHSAESMSARPVSSRPRAGQPNVTQAPQAVQESLTNSGGSTWRSSSTQGERNTMTEMSSLPVASLRARRTAAASLGSTTRTSSTPRAATTASMFNSRLGRFCRVTPLKGLPWRPVIAVVRLSSTHTVPAPRLYTVEMSELNPEWANVESPMTATMGRCSVPASASSKPWAMETEAPMSTVVSMAESGGRAPKV